MPFDQRLQLKPSLAHLDAKCLGFKAPGHCAPVIVEEHDPWATVQFRIENALGGYIEVVAVHQCKEELAGAAMINLAAFSRRRLPHQTSQALHALSSRWAGSKGFKGATGCRLGRYGDVCKAGRSRIYAKASA